MSTFCSIIHFIVFHFIGGEGGCKGRKCRFHFLLCLFFLIASLTIFTVYVIESYLSYVIHTFQILFCTFKHNTYFAICVGWHSLLLESLTKMSDGRLVFRWTDEEFKTSGWKFHCKGHHWNRWAGDFTGLYK